MKEKHHRDTLNFCGHGILRGMGMANQLELKSVYAAGVGGKGGIIAQLGRGKYREKCEEGMG